MTAHQHKLVQGHCLLLPTIQNHLIEHLNIVEIHYRAVFLGESKSSMGWLLYAKLPQGDSQLGL